MNLLLILALLGGYSHASDQEPVTLGGKTASEWVVLLRDKNVLERQRAVMALGLLGPDAGVAIPDLIICLEEPRLAQYAVDALGRIGPDAAIAIPILIEKLRDRATHPHGSLYSHETERALARIGAPVVPSLVAILAGPEEEMHPPAAEILGLIGPPARAAVPLLIRFLEDDPTINRNAPNAVVALGRIGPDASLAIPALNALLVAETLENWQLHEIVHALDQIGAPPVARLLALFLDTEVASAAHELALLGPKAKAAIPTLRKALADERIQVRIDAARALALIDPTAHDALSVLIDGLEHHPDEAGQVPTTLGRLGPRAEEAILALLNVANNGNALALRALVQVDPAGKQCLPTLIFALKSDDHWTAFTATECLSLLGPLAIEAAPALANAMTRNYEGLWGEEENAQIGAAKALGRIGPGPVTIPALIEALKYRHTVRGEGLGPKGMETDTYAAEAAATVLGSFGPEAKAAVPALIEALRATGDEDDGSFLPHYAALALGRIGPDARAAIPVLRAEADREDSNICDVSMIALAKIEPAERERLVQHLASVSHPERRARFLGSMGRPCVEADALVRRSLENLEMVLATLDPDDPQFLEGWFEPIGRFGVGGRSAIPRLEQLREHCNPWIRLWATETLGQIQDKDAAATRQGSRR